ncbi:oocyte zinc finger protein XlCOF6.1-like [Perognathus longimembris pacificus]|uniref:oocyte zinc finger protein XlCOF6.1-like n=1 Tax=Perognathus longimembris pacificus TaxID=214514 RepID=UPI00201982B8|nr:oocyte zinc finger protein XlCOF6.1-like [Perognathus longimembris pacificus]
MSCFCQGVCEIYTNTKRSPAQDSDQKPFPCGQCSKSLIQRDLLTQHLRLHSGERHVQCSVCSKSFQARADMKMYQLLHRAEMPFACKCGKGFAQRFKLVVHIRTHISKSSLSSVISARNLSSVPSATRLST